MSQQQHFIDALGRDMTELLWTGNTLQVYPATLQGFSIGSLLPAMMYMFRRGHRRGRGRFAEVFSFNHTKIRPNIFCVSARLSQSNRFEGFSTEEAKDILGDLLLCDALENKGGEEGHSADVLRAFPVHYAASWLDLPSPISNLRFVPEMIVSLLSNQPHVLTVRMSDAGEFSVGMRPEKNPLLRVFDRGVVYGNNVAALAGDGADRISEVAEFSVEEWLMVQLAQTCGQAPERLRRTQGDDSISANQPLARRPSRIFREDMSCLLCSFGSKIPRRGLTPMLECLIGLGLWNTFLGSLSAIVHWERNFELPDLDECPSFFMFADASSGTEPGLREIAEASGFELTRLINEATVALAVVRVMDAAARNNRRLRDNVPDVRHLAEWLTTLGKVRRGEHTASDSLRDSLSEKNELLLRNLNEQEASEEACSVLKSPTADADPARALAEALVLSMGSKLLQTNYFTFIDSAGMTSEPHGLLKKRRLSRRLESGKKQRMDVRSLVLSNTLLDTLVHTMLAKRQGRVSFADFLQLLKSDYGILVDEVPAGIDAEREDLLCNRDILEKRLRDLGLLTGVNDAESMKRLRVRYQAAEINAAYD